MGYEQRQRQTDAEIQAQVNRIREMVTGEMRPHKIHEDRCPKCGGEGAPEKRWCAGHIAMLPDEVEQPCKLNGDHLHGKCRYCSYTWREACAPQSLKDEPVASAIDR